ncbi:MAG: Crp/Fnr family transcriptional regulator [Blastochloris sp.]|nr:Crp/Fnr family transcriptional regulator [Blastochloris sp.]
MNGLARTNWIAEVPGLNQLDEEARALIAARTPLIQVPKGKQAFAAGADCSSYLVVVRGTVRVQLIAENGREIVLYRVRSGESCVLTTSCLMMHASYSAEAVAEDNVLAAALPGETFRTLLANSATFREFVLASYADRVADLILTMEDAVFHRIDHRLARTLLARGVTTIAGTHQELAAELGSAREVVSRQLKSFEKQGLVALSRGRIDIVDRTRLMRLADQTD